MTIYHNGESGALLIVGGASDIKAVIKSLNRAEKKHVSNIGPVFFDTPILVEDRVYGLIIDHSISQIFKTWYVVSAATINELLLEEPAWGYCRHYGTYVYE